MHTVYAGWIPSISAAGAGIGAGIPTTASRCAGRAPSIDAPYPRPVSDVSISPSTRGAHPGRRFPLPGRFRAVVFDMDGLLLDSERAWEAAERRLMARHGMDLTEADRLASLGRSVDDVIGWYGARLGVRPERLAELRDELMALVREEYADIEPMPGARELVDSLRGRVPLAVASNTDRALVDHTLAATGFAEAMDVVVTVDDVANAKPAPDIYLLATERLGVRPDEAVALEDSETGIRSAKAAGLFTVAVPQLDGLDVSQADEIVDSLERLLEGEWRIEGD